MGIFADFYAQAKSIDLSPPRVATARVIWNDLQRLEAQHSDLDYPAGFAGRPAAAILHVTGVIGTLSPLTITFDRGNNTTLPKEPTIRALAAEAAIENNEPTLEDRILDGIKYPASPQQQGTPDAPTFIPQPGTDPGLPVHSFLFETGLPVTASNTINATRGGTTMIASAGTVYETDGQTEAGGKAARYLATEGKFVLANTQWVDGTGPWHASLWWKRRDVVPGGFTPIVFQGGGSGAYTFQLRAFPSGAIDLRCWDSANSLLGQPSPAFFSTTQDEWVWIDFFYDGSDIGIAANNGNHDTVSAPIGLHYDAGADDLELGSQALDNDLDSFMIWNKKLTDDERDWIYNLGRGWEHA